MKIAIVTIVGYQNYGNRLQNYALQRVLESMGNEVTTIKNLTNVQNSLPQRIFDSLTTGTFLKKMTDRIKLEKKNNDEIDGIRESNFKNFTDRYIHETSFTIDETTLDFNFDRDFDCYVIGSDQVWNYDFSSFSALDFASFSEKPKISYAASFGVENIPSKYHELYRRGLKGITTISVRERSGVQLVSQLADRSATVVLDPTLLIDRKDWESLTISQPNYAYKYIALYFLDNLQPDDRAYIQDFARERHLKIKRLGDRSDVKLWESGPESFLNVIRQAEFVFTDSFHACVFSIIFEKKFEVFHRNNIGPSMDSRLDTLLDDFDLLSRWHDVNTNVDHRIDYGKVNLSLMREKKMSLKFLRSSLNKVEKMM
ncbi:polysaccharide pyruvyl transferase family protein [Levilactobacillus sp. HBUAS70063]|uniref:polysaccharide pyruvyl transferase family protein n=1 Tax=Levilactobacillus sp. HBUAS70063 TaxID=3109359 RepID=UPI003132E9DC